MQETVVVRGGAHGLPERQAAEVDEIGAREKQNDHPTIFENDVVIVKDTYKRKVNLGNTSFDKGTTIIHQIANNNQGNGYSSVVLNKFLNEVKNKVILTVRKSNQIARKFYEKNNFLNTCF